MTERCPSPEDLSAYLDGALPADACSRTAAHLASCSACEVLYADLRALRADFEALPDERLGFDLAQVIRGRIEASPPRTKLRFVPGWRRLFPVGIGAAASVSLGLALGMSLTAPAMVAPAARAAAVSALEVFAPIAPGGLCPGMRSCWRQGASTGQRP